MGSNLFEYAASSPTMFIDPYGDLPLLACASGGLVGAGLYWWIAGEKATVGGLILSGGGGCALGVLGQFVGTRILTLRAAAPSAPLGTLIATNQKLQNYIAQLYKHADGYHQQPERTKLDPGFESRQA